MTPPQPPYCVSQKLKTVPSLARHVTRSPTIHLQMRPSMCHLDTLLFKLPRDSLWHREQVRILEREMETPRIRSLPRALSQMRKGVEYMSHKSGRRQTPPFQHVYIPVATCTSKDNVVRVIDQFSSGEVQHAFIKHLPWVSLRGNGKQSQWLLLPGVHG